LTALIASSISVFLALYFSRKFSIIIPKINYKLLVLSIITFIILLTYLLCGALGLSILTISTFIGFIPAIVKCSRTHAMGCLILPVLIYFLL
ncbi:tripartite tricarboxylate transporter permease, partial [Candidatus Woesearchaeota archaeon]|nr:tripartite tricarboxylate transporter permease [Candidatus Woesearchaeota archaeon]